MNAGNTIEAAPAALRLAAIDLDGTLLGPDLTISEANRRAVTRLQEAGLEVVLASGRHYLSMEPFARQLPGVRWIVSTQGGEVSDLSRRTLLRQAFLRREQVEGVLAARTALGTTAMLYAQRGIFTDTSNAEVNFYRRLSGVRPERIASAAELGESIYKIVWVTAPEIAATLPTHPRVKALDVQTVRTHARLVEFMPAEVSKATGLAALAQHLGLTSAHVVAFGDADNDIPMFEWAAASYAMAHGWPGAKQSARSVAPDGPPETAFARAVDALCEAQELAPPW